MTATHLADTSAWAQIHRSEVAARLGSLFVGGGAATCGLVDLEALAAVAGPAEHAEALAERRLFPQVPVDDAVLARAAELQGLVGPGVPVNALVVAAAAERAGLILLHSDPVFERIAAVSGQPVEGVS